MTTPLSETVARLRELLALATPSDWSFVSRLDTYNIMSGRRCIARLQKKVGAATDTSLLVALHNAAPALLEAAERVEALEQLLRGAEANEGMGESEAIHQARRAEAAEARLAQVEGSKLVRNMAEEIDYLRSQLATVKADADRWRGLVELARPGQIVSISEQNGVWEVDRKGVYPRAPIDIPQLANTPEDALAAALREREGRE
jgi:hypothetical protein